MNRGFFTRARRVPAMLLAALGAAGCGGSNGLGHAIIGYPLSADNMIEAARQGVRPLALFPVLGELTGVVVEVIADAGNSSPYDLDDMLCPGGGAAELRWNGLDRDHEVVLTFSDCHFDPDSDELVVDGTLTYRFLAALDEDASPVFDAAVGLNIRLTEREGAAPAEAGEITGDLPLRLYAIDGDFIAHFGGDDDLDALVREFREGSEVQRFGCFDVAVGFPDRPEGGYLLGDVRISSIYGVSVANNRMLAVEGRATSHFPDLDFREEDGEYVPVDGAGLNFYGRLPGPGCAVAGVPDGPALPVAQTMSLVPAGLPAPPWTVALSYFPDGDFETASHEVAVVWSELE